MINQINQTKTTRIAVVGDVHDFWDADDAVALKHLEVDLVLFVGDFGNESVATVRAIADLDLPKAAVMGNHDAWYSASDWGRKQCPYNREQEDWVQQQLDLLGDAHVGYGKLDFPAFNLTVVGSRPFSWGGAVWKNAQFYQARYGITSFAASTARIVNAASSATYNTIIFLGHSGPTGLGDRPEDPCGKDWHPIGGDYGDPDLAAAIRQTRRLGKKIPLVAFGHMHHQLRHTQQLLRTPVHADADGTIYLNAASVPRIVQMQPGRCRNFSLVSLEMGVVSEIALVWLAQDLSLATQQTVYRRGSSLVQPAYR